MQFIVVFRVPGTGHLGEVLLVVVVVVLEEVGEELREMAEET